jgi:tRNA A37 N6-isopentenylltransferase MiaA
MDLLAGRLSEGETRALIVRENMRYARRQLTWFIKEPDIRWLETAGERADTQAAALDLVSAGIARQGVVSGT